MKKENIIRDLLIELKISDENSIVSYFPRTRDRDDVGVLRCERSGVIFLDRTDHISLQHYNEKTFNGLGAEDRKSAISATKQDTQRRAQQFKELIAHKKWLDIGTGAGGDFGCIF